MRKQLWIPLAILALLLLFALFAPWLAPYDPQFVNASNRLLPPSSHHLLGTDQLGRDILSRLIYGTRFSLLLAVIIVFLESGLGLILGLIVGWYQGRLETSFLWLVNLISAFPTFLVSLAIASFLGQGLWNLVIALVAVRWIYYARLMINLVKTASQEDFVLSARLMGLPFHYILKQHIFPFVYRPILVLALMSIGQVILLISGMSFLGIGIQPDVAEWGMMLHDARPYFRTASWMMLVPGFAIFLTVMSFNLLSDFFDQKRKEL